MSLIIGIIASAQSGPNAQTYFIGYTTQGSSNLSLQYNGMVLDNADSIYRGYQRFVGADRHSGITKYTSLGVPIYSRIFQESGGTPYDYVDSFAVNPTNSDVRVIAAPDINGAQSISLSLLNTDGTFASTSWLRWDTGGNSYPRSTQVDSSGNIYIASLSGYDGTGFQAVTTKHNSSGTLQWQRKFGHSGSWTNPFNCAVDSSANVFICGNNNATGSYKPLIIKYNTSGTFQAQWGFTDSGNNEYAYNCKVDSSGNVYAIFFGGAAGSGTSHIVKLDSSGTILWQRKLSSDTFLLDIELLDDDNIYVSGTTGTSGFLAKYNASGTIQWQRTISNVTNTNIASLKNNSIYLNSGAIVSGYSSAHFLKVPNDGSKTGSYTVGSITNVYAASSVAESAGTLSRTTIAYTSATFDYSTTSYSYTNNSDSLTTSRTVI
jgi:hypothetical protein